jgi:YVTN family beta-propeller protein
MARIGALLTALVAMTLFAVSPAAAAGGATRGFVVDGIQALVAFDPATNTVTHRFPSLLVYAIRPDGREVYAGNTTTNTVAVIETASMTVVATIPIGATPAGVAFTPDNRRAYVSGRSPSTVTVIDTTSRRVVRTISLSGSPFEPAVSPDGSRVYVGIFPSALPTEVVVISTATDTVAKRIPLPGGNPRLVRFSPDGRIAVVNTGGAVIDTRTETVVRHISLGSQVQDFVFAPDGTTVYSADICSNNDRGAVRLVDVRTGATLRLVIDGRQPRSLALTPDGTALYVVLDGTRNIVVVDRATERILDTFGTAESGHESFLSKIGLSGSAPAARPGQRFVPEPPFTGSCVG